LRRLLHFCIKGIIFLAAALLILGIWLRIELKSRYYGAASAETFVDISKGASTGEIANLLADQGILHASLPFKIYLRLSHLESRIQAGEYRFSEPATPIQIARRLVRGDIYFRSITIPEGLTAKETIALLADKGLGDRKELEQALQRVDWIRDLDPSAHNLEGYLFPETYRFGRKDNSETIIRTMIAQFRTKMGHMVKAAPLPQGWSMARIVTLASLIEKEVKKPEERPLVASVLINRLKKKMPLGCDATIIYAMKLADAYSGRIRKKDLQMESPYNSYLHRDLPPGPICSPGMDSIKASLHPSVSDYFYYVSRNDGTHQFSKDLRTHMLAVYKYQKSPSRKKAKS
jgi:UPF0755 protein